MPTLRGSNWMPKPGYTRGRQMHKCRDCNKKQVADAEKPRFPDHAKRQAVQMCIEDMSLSAANRIVGASVASASRWVKEGGAIAREGMRARSVWRTSGRAATIAPSTIASDEMWIYAGARRKGKRNSVWVWTAMVEERDSGRWMDFEVGGRDEAAFLRLLGRMPDAERYEIDGCKVYEWLPHNKHVVRKYGSANWNEGLHSMLRGRLNRLVRRTKGYTKSVDMPVNLLAPVFCDNLNTPLVREYQVGRRSCN